ncbi:MAG: O-antigen ligase family protein [Hyphomicrobiaceae bacterium]
MNAYVSAAQLERDGEAPRSLTHRLSLGLVWLAIASGAVVFTEPAPIDALLMGLVVLLPTVGLVAFRRELIGYLACWLLIVVAAVVASGAAVDVARASTHTFVTLYLVLASFILAGFVARRPVAHSRLILNAYLVSTILASLAAIVGFFALVPGAQEAMTRFGRAAGTFKDPNVLGPFLVLGLLYAMHLALERTLLRALWPLATAALLAFALILTFSRGAWANLVVAGLAYGYLSFLTARSNWYRVRLMLVGMVGLIGSVLVVGVALQFDAVTALLSDRAALVHGYDVGPEGRFGGQEKALELILQHPFGLGALEFANGHHHEDVHNVYLNMFLNAGWLGGLLYIGLIATTLAIGFRSILRVSPARPLLILAYSAFLGHAAEGVLVDTDHWRHVFVILSLVWGLVAVAGRQAAQWSPRRDEPILDPVLVLPPSRRMARVLAPAPLQLAAPARRAARALVPLLPSRRSPRILRPILAAPEPRRRLPRTLRPLLIGEH